MTDEVPVLRSPLLEAVPGLTHAFFTRQGGVSEGVYATLNAGRGSADEPSRVEANRRRAAGILGLEPGALATAYQVHSTAVVAAERTFDDPPPRADAVIAATTALAATVLTADCAPVLVADPEARIGAAVHAGWRGALAGVVEAAIDAMTRMGADPSRMIAAVGPCIGPKSYEVGPEFEATFVSAEAGNARFFAPATDPERRLFDLPGYVLARLSGAGVTRAHWVERDTFVEEALFFSNRRAVKRGETDYGLLLSAIGFKS